MTKIWLVKVGSSKEPLADRWIEECPDLLREWPSGPHTRSIKSGDVLIYYAATHQKLIAVARATEDGRASGEPLRVQVKLAIPQIAFAPSYTVLGKAPQAIMGLRAAELTDDEYQRGCRAFIAGLRPAP